MSSKFETMPPAGTIGYHAAISRPASSRARTCQTGKYATRAAAVLACMRFIAAGRVSVKATDKIVSHEWTSTGDSWQCNVMDIFDKSESITIEQAARALKAATAATAAESAS